MNTVDQNMVIIDHLSYTYPTNVEALHDINLSIMSGEAVGIIGENGAGKSTLVKHFNGLLKPSKGQVTINGYDTRKYSAADLSHWAGLCFQNPDDQLFQRTVQKEVSLGPQNLRFDASRIEKQVRWALEVVGMSDKAHFHPYDLDLSSRKLVAIASILAMDTPIIILDEPTTGQDQLGIEVLARVVRVLQEKNKTVISISHDMDFVARNFPRVIAMADTHILMDGSADEVFSNLDMLSRAGVEPPLFTQLAIRMGWAETAFDVEAFVALVERRLR